MDRRSPTARLSLGALGVGLVLLVSLAWASGVLYVIARLGLPSPVSLALVDGVHVYVGLASIAFFAAKLSRVGLHEHVSGVPELVAWQRWISWSLAGLYTTVYATGLLLLAPWSTGVAKALVNAHLLTAVWAAVPSAWHVWHYRPRAMPYLTRLDSRTSNRFWLAMALVLLPLLLVAAVPRSLSPAAKIGLGSWWESGGLQGVFLDRLATTSDGQALIAGGEGLYVKKVGAAQWRRVSFPSELILGLAVAPGGVYVGTTGGLYASPAAIGPFHRLALPAREVHGIAVDAANDQVIWASSRSGFWRSADGGEHWTIESAGVMSPENAWAIAYFRGSLYASDATRVYRWDGSTWQTSSDQGLVVSLDASADSRYLFASSMGRGVSVMDGAAWVPVSEGLTSHSGRGGAIHVDSVTAGQQGPALAATMLNGVAISHDGGQNWSELTAGLPRGAVWRVIQVDQRLIAATDHGIYEYHLPPVTPAAVTWWVALIAAALGTGILAMARGAFPR